MDFYLSYRPIQIQVFLSDFGSLITGSVAKNVDNFSFVGP